MLIKSPISLYSSCTSLNILKGTSSLHKTDGIYLFSLLRTFHLVLCVRLFGIFGIMRDGSLLIHSLASFICFTFKTSFKMVPTLYQNLSKMVLEKGSKFRVVLTIRFCSNFTIWYKYLLRNICRDFRIPMSTSSTARRKSLTSNYLQKMIFRAF